MEGGKLYKVVIWGVGFRGKRETPYGVKIANFNNMFNNVFQ